MKLVVLLPRDAVLYSAIGSIGLMAVAHYLSISLSVRLWQLGVQTKRLNVGSCKQRRTVAWRVWFSDAKDLDEILMGLLPRWH